MNTIDIHNDKFVSMQFITELTGLSDKWFYKLAQEGKFPKPVKFGRSSRWIEREVKEWLEARINDSTRQLKIVIKRSLTLHHVFILQHLVVHGLHVIYKDGLFIIVFDSLSITY